MSTYPKPHDAVATVTFLKPLLIAIRHALRIGIQAKNTADMTIFDGTDPDPSHSAASIRRKARAYLRDLGHPDEPWVLVRNIGFSGIKLCWGPYILKLAKALPDGGIRAPVTPAQQRFCCQELQYAIPVELPEGGEICAEGGNIIVRWLEGEQGEPIIGACRPEGVWDVWEEANVEWDVWGIQLDEGQEEEAFVGDVRTDIPAALLLDEDDYRLTEEEEQ